MRGAVEPDTAVSPWWGQQTHGLVLADRAHGEVDHLGEPVDPPSAAAEVAALTVVDRQGGFVSAHPLDTTEKYRYGKYRDNDL